MADRWMDERDRQWRDRDWRRNERTGGSDRDDYRGGYGGSPESDRSFEPNENYRRGMGGGGYSDRYQPQQRQPYGPVFGERETGANYTDPDGGRRYAGEVSGQSRGGSWQGYQGRSPNERSGYQSRQGGHDYERGGRFYGDDGRAPIYRENYGQGGREYGQVPGGYDAGRGGDQGESLRLRQDDYARSHHQENYRRDEGRQQRSWQGGGDHAPRFGQEDYARRDMGRTFGEYGGRFDDSPRPYRADHDRNTEARWPREDERSDDRGHSGGRNFFERATEKLSSWFGYDEGDRGGGYQSRGEHRGRGPQGYKRSDERITEEVHDRLTDDPWLDASNINVSVSGGEVTLSGTVNDREAKHRAERIVEELSGVNHVQNNLRIQKGNFLTDPGRGFGDSANQAQMRQSDIGSAKTQEATTLGADPTMGQPQERTSTGRKTDS